MNNASIYDNVLSNKLIILVLDNSVNKNQRHEMNIIKLLNFMMIEKNLSCNFIYEMI